MPSLIVLLFCEKNSARTRALDVMRMFTILDARQGKDQAFSGREAILTQDAIQKRGAPLRPQTPGTPRSLLRRGQLGLPRNVPSRLNDDAQTAFLALAQLWAVAVMSLACSVRKFNFESA